MHLENASKTNIGKEIERKRLNEMWRFINTKKNRQIQILFWITNIHNHNPNDVIAALSSNNNKIKCFIIIITMKKKLFWIYKLICIIVIVIAMDLLYMCLCVYVPFIVVHLDMFLCCFLFRLALKQLLFMQFKCTRLLILSYLALFCFGVILFYIWHTLYIFKYVCTQKCSDKCIYSLPRYK